MGVTSAGSGWIGSSIGGGFEPARIPDSCRASRDSGTGTGVRFVGLFFWPPGTGHFSGDSMSTFIFVGPTIGVGESAQHLDATFLPPVSQGDVYRITSKGARAIGIIDGYFESVPAVWHKEILWAMSQGVHVFGSASMGACRAAELHAFGMIGVGHIFESFLRGDLEDDDEVAVAHCP